MSDHSDIAPSPAPADGRTGPAVTVSAVSRRNLPSQVVEQIGHSIVSGVFPEGTTLPNEAILAGDLGVSRNVLREAVKVLVSKGMLEVRPKVGTTVRPKEFWYMLDPAVLAWEVSGNLHLPHVFNFCEFRLIVEPKAAFLAAQRASEEDIHEIRAACARLETCVTRFAEMPEADIAFHQTIHRASHNAVLQHLAKMTIEIMRAQVAVTAGVPDDFLRGLPLHRGVTEAITARDAPRAEALSRALCEMPYLDLAARLSEGGLAPDLVIGAKTASGQKEASRERTE